MNTEISAFSSGDLNKYEFLKKIDLNYKPNALDKARFEFSPLGKTFSTGLDKNAQGYQEEGVIKLLKDIRDGLRGVNRRPNDNRRNDEFDNGRNDEFDNRSDDDGSFDDDNSSFNDDDSFDDDDNGSVLNKKYNSLLLKHFQLRKNMNDTSKELKDELDKTKDELDIIKDELIRQKMNYMILMILIVLMKMVFIKILVSIMILMVLIAMVFIQKLMINIIIMVLI